MKDSGTIDHSTGTRRARLAPWIAVGLAALWLLGAASPPREGEYRVTEFSRLPVVYQGRVKPIDTLARNSLMIVSKKQTFVDADGRSQPAVHWLLDVMAGALREHGPAEKHRVFRIENDQVLALVGLAPRPNLRYAVEEFSGRMEALQTEAERARARAPAERDLVDVKILELYEQVRLYVELARLEIPHLVPPMTADETWKPFAEAAGESQTTGRDNAAARSLGGMLMDWLDRKPEAFNQDLAAYRETLDKTMPEVLRRTDFEVFFNRFEPFYRCAVLYVALMLLAFCSWLGWSEPLRRSAYRLLILTLLVHSLALVARMWLQGYAPVTNLYSSAIFIGWGIAGLAVGLEAVFRNGLAAAVAGLSGFLTMLIAHHLSGDGDTMEMMQAVLDTNFWLATHVTVVTLGYSATFLAGLLGTLTLVLGVFTNLLGAKPYRSLGKMTYAILCFAMLFSFVGTVLGGIWADQSWGRFWGWDPKENGAFMIVLWNALILHARWGGMVRERGIAVLAVFGNIVTGWSWFGVNMLGVGLHSYGFMNSAAFWLSAFAVSQVAVMGLGLVPPQYWRSRTGGAAQPVA